MTIPDRPGIKGHELMALERFMDDTRHMIEFDVLSRIRQHATVIEGHILPDKLKKRCRGR